MEELAKIIKSFDDEKKKKLFSDLSNATTVEGVMDVGNNYNLNITKEMATQMYEEFKDANKLTHEEMAKISGGGGLFCFRGVLNDLGSYCYM